MICLLPARGQSRNGGLEPGRTATAARGPPALEVADVPNRLRRYTHLRDARVAEAAERFAEVFGVS